MPESRLNFEANIHISSKKIAMRDRPVSEHDGSTAAKWRRLFFGSGPHRFSDFQRVSLAVRQKRLGSERTQGSD